MGHVSIKKIDSYTSLSIGLALRRVEMRYKVHIKSVWTDAFGALKKESLGPHLSQCQEIVWEDVSGLLDDVRFHTNIPYTKCRSYVERKVREVKALLCQCQLPAAKKPRLLGEE